MRCLLQTKWAEIVYVLLNFHTMEHEISLCVSTYPPCVVSSPVGGEMLAMTDAGVTANGTARWGEGGLLRTSVSIDNDCVCIHLSDTKLNILEGHRKDVACNTVNSIHRLKVYSYPYVSSTLQYCPSSVLCRSNFAVKLHSGCKVLCGRKKTFQCISLHTYQLHNRRGKLFQARYSSFW
jgi:hypothetical protein